MVELLVSIFIGLAVLGGAGSVFLTSLRGESDNARVTRLNQDMRSMMDIMVRDIRRAGFVTDNTKSSFSIPALSKNPFFSTDDANYNDIKIHNEDGSCITYSYNSNNNFPTDSPPPTKEEIEAKILTIVDSSDRFGFRLDKNKLDMRRSGTTNINCEDGVWETITEPEVEITGLVFTLNSASINVTSMRTDTDGDGCKDGDDANANSPATPCTSGNYGNNYCDAGEPCTICTRDGSPDPACLVIRSVQIQLTGRLKNDHNVTQILMQTVRIRNDKFLAAIP